jgi:hypothetical protein
LLLVFNLTRPCYLTQQSHTIWLWNPLCLTLTWW